MVLSDGACRHSILCYRRKGCFGVLLLCPLSLSHVVTGRIFLAEVATTRRQIIPWGAFGANSLNLVPTFPPVNRLEFRNWVTFCIFQSFTRSQLNNFENSGQIFFAITLGSSHFSCLMANHPRRNRFDHHY